MVKHIILWKIKDEYSEEEKAKIKINAKSNLEGLMGKIEGLQNINIQIESLETSTADLMLDSTFESKNALKNYSVNPEHVAVANTFVRPFMKERTCLDYLKK